MFTKILLACCGSSQTKTLLGRVKITVGESSEYRGYRKGMYGSCEVLEGEIQTSNSSGANYFSGLFSALNITTNPMTTLMLANDPASAYIVENETNGVKHNGFASPGVSFSTEIFEGIETGQECVIAIYYI